MASPSVFVSYSHLNEDEKNSLMKQLGVLKKAGIGLSWVDDEIKGGEDWEAAIWEAVDNASLAILMITAEFLNSSFIMNHEAPHLLERRNAGQMEVIPLIVKPCAWDQVDWLKALNVRPKNGHPIWASSDDPHAEEKLAQFAREVADLLKHQTNADMDAKPLPGGSREFQTRMDQAEICLVDEANRLIISDLQEIKIFSLNRLDPVWRSPFPDFACKTFLERSWRGGLVLADWLGNLFLTGEAYPHNAGILRKAKYDSAPIHLLEIGAGGELVAGAWDGCLMQWDSQGGQAWPDSPKLEHLPTHLFGFGGGWVAAADQAGGIHLLDEAGQTVWSQQSASRIKALWGGLNQDGQKDIYYITQDWGIYWYNAGQGAPEKLDTLASPLSRLSHRFLHDTNPATLLALQDGSLLWLSWPAKRILKNSLVQSGQSIRQIEAVQDPQRAYSDIAVGLTKEGRVFSLVDSDFKLVDATADKIALNPGGHFIYLLKGGQVRVMRNPSLEEQPCKMKLTGTTGNIKKGAYSKLGIRLKNTGQTRIGHLKASLEGAEVQSDSPQIHKDPIMPGMEIELHFSLKALTQGEMLPVTLHLKMQDELGSRIWNLPLNMDLSTDAE